MVQGPKTSKPTFLNGGPTRPFSGLSGDLSASYKLYRSPALSLPYDGRLVESYHLLFAGPGDGLARDSSELSVGKCDGPLVAWWGVSLLSRPPTKRIPLASMNGSS